MMTNPGTGPRPTVLIVDDEPDGRTSLGWVLRASGFDTLEAGTGTDALRLAADRPDLVVLDVVLPDLSGVEVCRRLKADPATARTPVLMLSGRAVAPTDQAGALEGGADAYLTKPADPDVLVAHLRALLRVSRAEARFRAVVEHAFDAIYLVSADGAILYASPGSERLLGRPRREQAGRNAFDFVHPDDLPGARERFARLVAEPGGVAESVHRARHADGSWRWLEARGANLLRDPAVGAVVVHFRDVTDRVAAEEARARLAAVVEGSEDAIVSSDLSGVVTSWNPAAERLFGYAAAEAVGRPGDAFIPPELRDTARGMVERVAAGERIAPYEAERVRKDGRRVPVQVTLSPVRVGGSAVGVSAIYQDVTEQRRLEDQLRQAQKMEAVGRLAGGVAHDFNNLLTVIIGYTGLLREVTPAGDLAREAVGEIQRAGERAAALTRQLLAFSRQAVLELRVVEVNALVRGIEDMLRRLIGEDVDLALRQDPDLGRVRVDPGQLEQALVNLCLNARDAMPTGGKLTVETRNADLDAAYAASHPEVAPGRYVMVAVSDTGVGMTPEIQARIFEPFFTTKEIGRGTGLGLAMVFGFAKQSGGHIAVYSEPGAGSTFKLFLPRVDAAPTADPPPGVYALPPGSETVLLVEDEEAVRALGRQVLAQCGYEVLEASRGDEAVRAAEAHPGRLDLVVTDVVMPGGMGGRQVAEAVLARHPEARVLFTSGYTDDAVVRHGIVAAGSAFLQKPFTPVSLAVKVRETLDLPRPEQG